MGKMTTEVNLNLASQHRELAGIKVYVTSTVDHDPREITGYCRRMRQIEPSFRMAKSDLRARPIFHTLRRAPDGGDIRIAGGTLVGVGDGLVAAETGWSSEELPGDADQRRRARKYSIRSTAAGAIRTNGRRVRGGVAGSTHEIEPRQVMTLQ